MKYLSEAQEIYLATSTLDKCIVCEYGTERVTSPLPVKMSWVGGFMWDMPLHTLQMRKLFQLTKSLSRYFSRVSA